MLMRSFESCLQKRKDALLILVKKYVHKKTLTKAIEMFKQKAKQGDLRAQYFLLRMLKLDGSVIEHETYFSNNYNFMHSAETRQHYLKEVIRFAENHYYQPLMDYVDTILTFDRKKISMCITQRNQKS